MVWHDDRVYPFTIARLLEGFLDIDLLTLSVPGFSWDLIVGGVDQGIVPTVHPGESVGLSMTVKNSIAKGALSADNFIIDITAIGATTGTIFLSETSPEIVNLALDATSDYSTSTFIMPDENINAEIRTKHWEEF